MQYSFREMRSYLLNYIFPSYSLYVTQSRLCQSEFSSNLFCSLLNVEMPVLNDEEMAYAASMYLFMNEVPVLEEKSSQMSTHLRHNGFAPGMLGHNQEQHYNNFPQVNHNNNNILPNDIMNMAVQLTNPLNLSGLAEEASIFDFDPTLLDTSAI